VISHLELVNFQCHDLTRIKLDKEVTAIVGPSDSGKSAIIRALKWVVFNRPLGSSFIKDGESSVSVRVKVDGKWVYRIKGDGENCYIVDGNRLDSVGTDVPEEVALLFNLGEENFQGQHDGPFWFCLTPGEIAKRINEIVDLDVMDKVLSVLKSKHRKLKTEEELLEKKLTELRKRYDDLSFVDDIKRDFDQLGKLSEELRKSTDRLNSLKKSTEKLRLLSESLDRCKRLVSDSEELVSVGDNLVSISNKLRRLLNIVAELKECCVLVRTEVPDMSGFDIILEEIVAVKNRMSSLVDLVKKIREAQVSLVECGERLEKAERVLFESIGGICPVCGGHLDLSRLYSGVCHG